MASPPPRVLFLEEVALRLGHGIVDIELDPAHYNFALNKALMRYRQRSDNSMEESFIFLDIQPDVEAYTLPDEVQEVRSIYRRSIGGTSGGAAIDPFSLAFTNNIYMIQNPGALGTSGSGFLATYDFAMGFQSLVGRMFGRDVMYTYNSSTKVLRLERKFSSTEQICVHAFNAKPEAVLLNDPYARNWLFDYTVAVAKSILGEGRGKFGQIAGPQGGITMNASELKQEAQAEMERLDKEINDYADSHIGGAMIIG